MDVRIHTRWSETFRRDESIVNTLVTPFVVVMGRERRWIGRRDASGFFKAPWIRQ